MSKHTTLGLMLWTGSIFLYLLQWISRLLERNLNIFSIEEVFGLDWIQVIPWPTAQQLMATLSTLSLSLLLLSFGILFLVMGVFHKAR